MAATADISTSMATTTATAAPLDMVQPIYHGNPYWSLSVLPIYVIGIVAMIWWWAVYRRRYRENYYAKLCRIDKDMFKGRVVGGHGMWGQAIPMQVRSNSQKTGSSETTGQSKSSESTGQSKDSGGSSSQSKKSSPSSEETTSGSSGESSKSAGEHAGEMV